MSGHWPISKYARETADFVNLYSKTRGLNRRVALTRFFELLYEASRIAEFEKVLPEYPPWKS